LPENLPSPALPGAVWINPPKCRAVPPDSDLITQRVSQLPQAQADLLSAVNVLHCRRLQYAKSLDKPAFVYRADLVEKHNRVFCQPTFRWFDEYLSRIEGGINCEVIAATIVMGLCRLAIVLKNERGPGLSDLRP